MTQVAQMWKIFSAADQMISWIGLEDDKSEAAFAVLREFQSWHESPVERQQKDKFRRQYGQLYVLWRRLNYADVI